MHTTKPRKRRGRRSAIPIATFTLMASALTLVAGPTAVGAEELPTVQALGAREPVFEGTLDATDAPDVARKAYRPDRAGTHKFILEWTGDAHPKLLIYDSEGDLIAKKGGTADSPKTLVVDLDAGEKYKIKVKATSGVAVFQLWVRAPEIDIDEYFDNIPRWSDVYGDPVGLNEDIGNWSKWDLSNGFACRTKFHRLGASADEIVTFGAKASWLYPGVLLQGHSFNGGISDIRQLPIRQRAPAEVFIDFTGLPGDEIKDTVEDPVPANIAAVLSEIIGDAEAASIEIGTSIDFRETQTHTAEQMALELGLSAKYMKTTVKAKLEMERSETETTVTVFFKEAAFTAAMTQPEFPGSFFSDDLTETILDRHIALERLDDDTNVPLYVDSVTYGRILVFSLTSSEDFTSIGVALQAMYNGGSLELTGQAAIDYQNFVANSTKRIVTIGGDTDDATAAITSGDFTQYFGDPPALTEYAPISYVVKDLGGETAFVMDEAKYRERECMEAAVRVTVDEMLLVDAQDDDGTDELDLFWVEARPFDGPGEPIYDGSDVCWLDDEISGENYQQVICWDDSGTVNITAGGPAWQDEDAAGGLWLLDIGLDDPDQAQIMFRAGYQDNDPGIQPDDWTRGKSGWLVGTAIWEDYLPEHDSTYRFQVINNGASWWVYLTIELVGADSTELVRAD